METLDQLLTNESRRATFEVGTPDWSPKSFRCHIAIIREEDGSFSAVALNLPGAGSCGDTAEEAMANAKEAILGVISGHIDKARDIPWIDSTQCTIPEGAKQKWILVNV
jgi:predicted RNase H-like HicB family nuclease